MSHFKTLLSHLKPQNPLSISQSIHKSPPFFSIYHRFFTSDQTQTQTQTPIQTKPTKPLHLLFREALELSPKTETPQPESEDNPLKKSLIELENEVKSLKANKKTEIEIKPQNSEPNVSLYAVFTNTAAPAPARGGRRRKEVTRERSNVGHKDLSQEMEVVVSHLYKEGYLNDANCLFVKDGRLDFGCFNSSYGRGFIKFAVERFAKDHQLIAKWLSGSDLKKVALFGCPSLSRKSVFGAKRLRKFFAIPENTVCSKCVLKESCNFVNQNVWSRECKNLSLTDVMNTITLYALDSVPAQVVVPDELKSAVSRLLKEALKLSQTSS